MVAALVLAEESEAPGATVGSFIASCWMPGLLACLRCRDVIALAFSAHSHTIMASASPPPTTQSHRAWSPGSGGASLWCESLHAASASLLLPLLRFCAAAAPSPVDWGSDWTRARAMPTTADHLDRLPREKVPDLQSRLDGCALAYVSCAVELAASASDGHAVAAAARSLVFPLLRSGERRLNALALLLARRCVCVCVCVEDGWVGC